MPKLTKQSNKPAQKSVPSSDGWPVNYGIKMNLYGQSGTGKTTLWATFPGPILALICSGGSDPGELVSIDTPEYRKKITPKIILDTGRMTEFLVNAHVLYQTVVLDHITSLQDLFLKELLGLSEIPVQKSWGLASRDQYGQCVIKTKETLRVLLSLKCNVVIVAQERDFKGDSGDDAIRPFVCSAVYPKVAEWFNPAVNYAGETFIRQRMRKEIMEVNGEKTEQSIPIKGKVDYCLRTAPDPVYFTKFRKPRGKDLPDVIVDPSFEKIKALIEGR